MVDFISGRVLRGSPEVSGSVFELKRDIAAKLLVVFTGIYLVWHFWLTVIEPVGDLWRIWAVSLVIFPVSLAVWFFIPHRYHLSMTLWQASLFTGVAIAAYGFQDARLYFLFCLIPFLAVITQGWKAGLFTEVVLIVIAYILSAVPLPLPRVAQTDLSALIGCGLAAGLLAWAITDTMLTIGEWYVSSFMRAKNSMDEIRLQRAQLAQVIKNLDQAYYRLQRTNADLVAAWKAAAEAERQKTEFASHISHELRTPLNLIAGFSELMMTSPENYGDTPLPGAYRRDLHTIYRSARHLLDLVDDVIDLARLDAGRLSISVEAVDPTALVQEAASMVRSYIEAKGLEFQVDIQPDLPPLRLDHLRIRQVLLNLLVNATRFTEKGSIRVSVVSHENQVRFSVSDTGRGIHPDDLERLFQEFNPGEKPKDSGVPWHSGSGLGLPISKKFVDLHQGKMEAESELGKGTTIWFELPAIPSEPPVETAGNPLKPELPVFLTDRDVAKGEQNRLALVLHPDRRLPQFLQRHLPGWRVRGIKTVEGIREIAAQEEVEAVLLDAHEPLQPIGLEIPVVACPLPSDRRLAAALGVQAFLSKPVTREDLFDAIDRLQIAVRRVLIVDDDAEMVNLLQRMLLHRIQPQDCLEACNGRQALDVLEHEQVDLILLDLMMPEVDGRELLSVMRSSPRNEETPVIVISALEEPASELVGELHIIPPASFSPAQMLGLVKTVLDDLQTV